MRTELKARNDGKERPYHGTIDCFGRSRGGNTYICITNVRQGEDFVSDHVWIESNDIRQGQDLEFRTGDQIDFTAKVHKYERNSVPRTSPDRFDYGLCEVGNVKNLSFQPGLELIPEEWERKYPELQGHGMDILFFAAKDIKDPTVLHQIAKSVGQPHIQKALIRNESISMLTVEYLKDHTRDSAIRRQAEEKLNKQNAHRRNRGIER